MALCICRATTRFSGFEVMSMLVIINLPFSTLGFEQHSDFPVDKPGVYALDGRLEFGRESGKLHDQLCSAVPTIAGCCDIRSGIHGKADDIR